ncbi:MAG: aminotransferase class V-fold PLP-dependent enzyme [bacterium]
MTSKAFNGNYIYLNNSATSFPKPQEVINAVKRNLEELPFHHARTGFGHECADVFMECRKLLASLFNVQNPSRIVFSSGSTASLNLAIMGLDLKDKHVVTTAIEHNSVLRPLKTLERDGIIKLSIADCDQTGYVSAENIKNCINKDTTAVIVNHCSNVTGAVNCLEEIGEITKAKNITFIVDASQSAGIIPIDVESMKIDILAFTGHKSLYGIQGIGGAYIRETVALKPLIVGGTGVRSDYLFQPEIVPMYFEAGTQNTPGIVSLYEGVKYVLEKSTAKIHQHVVTCCNRMKEELCNNTQLILYPANNKCIDSTIFSFNIIGMEPNDIGYIMENSFGIIVRAGLHCAPLIHKQLGTFPDGSVRVSPSSFTTDKEIDSFLFAIREICAVCE